jgi:hypothetical protein
MWGCIRRMAEAAMKTSKPKHDQRDWYEFIMEECPPKTEQAPAASSSQAKPAQTTIDRRRVIAHN